MIKNKRCNISQKNTKMYTKPSPRTDTLYTKVGKKTGSLLSLVSHDLSLRFFPWHRCEFTLTVML